MYTSKSLDSKVTHQKSHPPKRNFPEVIMWNQLILGLTQRNWSDKNHRLNSPTAADLRDSTGLTFSATQNTLGCCSWGGSVRAPRPYHHHWEESPALREALQVPCLLHLRRNWCWLWFLYKVHPRNKQTPGYMWTQIVRSQLPHSCL